jgi:PRTRC genetic system protein A
MNTRAVHAIDQADAPGAGLVGYVLNRNDAIDYPPKGAMFDYILAADGVYLHAQREDLVACFKIAPAEIRGLRPGEPIFDFALPDVPANLVSEILGVAMNYAADSKETLFWLEWSDLNPYNDGWLLREPEQNRTGVSCRPADGQEEAYERAIIEIHSHHSMPPRFSPTDDEDERGFRIYGVIGNLPEEPAIRMRIGVYGYFDEIPASWVMELPAALKDCNAEEEEL